LLTEGLLAKGASKCVMALVNFVPLLDFRKVFTFGSTSNSAYRFTIPAHRTEVVNQKVTMKSTRDSGHEVTGAGAWDQSVSGAYVDIFQLVVRRGVPQNA
jgi:hypothetical protein